MTDILTFLFFLLSPKILRIIISIYTNEIGRSFRFYKVFLSKMEMNFFTILLLQASEIGMKNLHYLLYIFDCVFLN